MLRQKTSSVSGLPYFGVGLAAIIDSSTICSDRNRLYWSDPYIQFVYEISMLLLLELCCLNLLVDIADQASNLVETGPV